MSGLCGIVPFDGAPVDRERLRAMTAALASRGPERQESRLVDGAGLGHAWLRTDPDAAPERQPLTLGDGAWIVADARIDDRERLRRDLAARGRTVAAACPDAALVLHAWHAWGEECAAHLLGDFAFAIWDGRQRALFCARDRFGVKPFFYAADARRFAFSNTLDVVCATPGVSARLDESVVADFLLCGEGRDPSATALADVRRLRPGSCLVARAGSVRSWAYWNLPEDPAVRPMRKDECVEAFGALLRDAVADRVRTRRVAVHMSGGLDSTTLAGLAKAALAARGPYELHAHHIADERLIPDGERHYAALAAERLSIPLHVMAADDHALHSGDAFAARFAEPYHAPDTAGAFHDSLRACARSARVLLTGYDGDALLEESPRPYFARLWRERRLLRLAAALARHARARRRLWPRVLRERPAALPELPTWILPEFERRMGLRERWRDYHAAGFGAGSIRPRALRDFEGLRASGTFFEQYDAGVTGLPLEVRHPLLDLRLVEFCLGVAPVPWCVDKKLLRSAARGILPPELLRRPKTPLAGWPGAVMLANARAGRAPQRHFVSPAVWPYVDPERVRAQARDPDPRIAFRALRALTLDRWISHAHNRLSTRRTHHETFS